MSEVVPTTGVLEQLFDGSIAKKYLHPQLIFSPTNGTQSRQLRSMFVFELYKRNVSVDIDLDLIAIPAGYPAF